MKVISILLAFINTLVGALLVLSCVSAGEALSWIAFKSGAGMLAVYFGVLTLEDGVQPLNRNRCACATGLFLVIVGVSALAWGIHWSIVSGDVKNAILLFGGSLFTQGLTSILGMDVV